MSVGIALCTFNGAAYVDDQIASILRQSAPVDELVVADDGSHDGTVDRVRGAVEAAATVGLHPPVLTVLGPARERLGVRANVQRALAASSADVVFLADQDDRWHLDKVERALHLLTMDPSASVVGTNARLWRPGTRGDRGGTVFETLRVGERERSQLDGRRAFTAVVRRNVIPGMTLAIRQQFLAAALPIPTAWTHDGWLVALAAATGGLRVDPAARVDYRQHDSNVVGVARRTPAYLVRRLTRTPPTAGRNVTRFEDLIDRLRAVDETDIVAASSRLAHDKLAFERSRAHYSTARPLRAPAVARQVLAGGYRRLAPNGRWDALRDLALRTRV